jgi:hypothetical protein
LSLRRMRTSVKTTQLTRRHYGWTAGTVGNEVSQRTLAG